MDFQETGFDPWLKVYPDRLHVPQELTLRFLEDEEKALLVALAGCIDERRGDACLASPRLPGDKDG